jgi:hypothetical protein
VAPEKITPVQVLLSEARRSIFQVTDLQGISVQSIDTEALERYLDQATANRNDINDELVTVEYKNDLAEVEPHRSTLDDRTNSSSSGSKYCLMYV